MESQMDQVNRKLIALTSITHEVSCQHSNKILRYDIDE